ncbi:MAG: hypothetical protein LC624_09275, partial [Halobacteriales archaeon]|nr:hypothetical protein [Halobacteriales archaeon]
MGKGRLTWALLLAVLVTAGAAGAVGAYYLQQRDAHTERIDHTWTITLRPLGDGPYELDLPLPSDGAGNPVRIQLRSFGAPVDFGVVRTEYGAALTIRGHGEDGVVTLRQDGGLPLHLSMDDQRTSFPQFKFWMRLAEGSPRVNLTLRLGEVNTTLGWESANRLGHTIVAEGDLEPSGWQRVRAEHDFDIWHADGAKST